MKAQEAPTFKGWLKKRRNAQKKEKTKRTGITKTKGRVF